MSGTSLEVRLDPDGVVRLVAMPTPKLDLKVASSTRVKTTLKLVLRGTSYGMPPGTPLRVVCKAGGRTSDFAATLDVPGWRAQTQQDCSAALDLPILAAGLFGAGSYTLEVTPQFPHAPTATTPAASFDHPFDVAVTKPAGKVLMGHTVTFAPKVSTAVFEGCQVRATVFEADARDAATDADLQVQLLWRGTGLNAPQTWRVGCDAAGALDYAEPAEDDATYEFKWRVDVSSDGATWFEARAAADLVTAPRPTLSSFVLEPRGQTLWARGTITDVAPTLEAPLHVALWAHRPAPWTDAGELRVLGLVTPARTARLAGGAFEVELFDAERPGGQSVAAPAVPFAVLDLHAGKAAALPLSTALVYDATKLRPFGDGDLPRTTGKQRPEAVAVAVCSEDVVGVPMFGAPHFGPIATAVVGDTLSIKAKLVGGDAAYWKAAAPTFELKPDGQDAWTALASSAPADELVASPSLVSGWAGQGKTALLRARATKDGKLQGAAVVAPTGEPSAPLTCTPAFGPLVVTRKGPGELRLEGTTRFVPVAPTKVGLKVTIETAATPPEPIKVTLTPATVVCEADGHFAVVAAAKAPATLPAGAKVRVGCAVKLGGVEVPEATAVVPA